MIDSLVSLSNVRVAGAPTFFPAEDPKKHRCLITVIKNRGKNQQNVELTDEFTLVMWGKYAQTGALYLDKGRAINVEGVLRSYTVDTGRLKPNGKKELNRTTSIHVKSFEFSADSKKELVKRISTNMAVIQAAKEAGTRDPSAPISAEELIVVNRPASYDYNPQLAMQTGRYGNAQVYIKGQGMLVPNGAAGVGANVASMQAQVAALKVQIAANTTGAQVENVPAAVVVQPETIPAGAEAQIPSPFG